MALLATLVGSVDFPRLGETCETNDDCLDEYESCNLDLVEPLCKHKGITPIEKIGSMVIILALFYSNCGGLGGGGS